MYGMGYGMKEHVVIPLLRQSLLAASALDWV